MSLGVLFLRSGVINAPLISIAQELGFAGDSMLMGLVVRDQMYPVPYELHHAFGPMLVPFPLYGLR
eukprot:4820706-Pyramimonas_sp.AAC.1